MHLVDAEVMKNVLGFENRPQVYDAVRRKHIPEGVAVRIGRKLRFDLEAAKEWIAKGGTPINDQHATASDVAQ